MKLAQRIFQLPSTLYLGVLMAIGALERWWGIGAASIWHDEGFSMMISAMSPHEIIVRTARDVHPPLYYLVLHYWTALFGRSEIAARSLSALFTLIMIPVVYLFMRRIWNERAARFSALLVAVGPFLIRYSQEARMYGMVAALLLFATYVLMRAVTTNQWQWWGAYSLLMAAALYTHYYAIFMVAVHWIYLLIQRTHYKRGGITNLRWWAANVAIVILFLPWLPTAFDQFSRVQGGFWIPPVTIASLASTMFEFAAFVPSTFLPGWLAVLLALPLPFGVYLMYRRAPAKRPELMLLLAYCLLGPALVFLVSLKQSVYIDRYFVFASVGFYCLVGVFISLLSGKRLARTLMAVGVFALIGLASVHINYYHKMRSIGAYVDARYQPGDELLSGEEYTFFDFSYYNHTGAPVHVWKPNGVSGYDESSLFYDKSDLIVRDLSSIHPVSGIVWVVGRTTDDRDYYNSAKLPTTWRPVGIKVIDGDSAVQAYRVTSRSASEVAVQ